MKWQGAIGTNYKDKIELVKELVYDKYKFSNEIIY